MNDNMKIIGLSALLVLALFGAWNWYSHEEQVIGVVSSKWVETSTSCDKDGDCTTTHTYLIQLENGNIYQVFWGSLHYDRIIPGDEIKFTARGYHVEFNGWRINQPSFFEFEIVSRKEVPGKPGSSLFFC